MMVVFSSECLCFVRFFFCWQWNGSVFTIEDFFSKRKQSAGVKYLGRFRWANSGRCEAKGNRFEIKIQSKCTEQIKRWSNLLNLPVSTCVCMPFRLVVNGQGHSKDVFIRNCLSSVLSIMRSCACCIWDNCPFPLFRSMKWHDTVLC